MSRKKDNNNDQRSLKSKAAAVLTGVAVGTAALRGSRVLAKGVPNMSKFANLLMEDVSDMKRKDFTASNISKLYKKHFSDENSTLRNFSKLDRVNNLEDLKRIDQIATPKLKLSTAGDNFAAAVIKMKEIKENSSNILRKTFNAEYTDKVVEALDKKYKIEDEDFKDRLTKLTRRGVEKDDLILYNKQDGTGVLNSKIIDSYLDPDKFNLGNSKDEFFDDLIGLIENKSQEFSDYTAKHTSEDGTVDLIKNIEKEFTGKTFAEAYGTAQDESVIQNLRLGDRGLTVRDYIDNIDKFDDQIIDIGENKISLKEEIVNLAKEHEEIMDVLVDAKNLRINGKDEVISFKGYNDAKEDVLRKFAGTLPGKLLKVTDAMSAQEHGVINFFEKGKASPLLSAMDGGSAVSSENYVQIMNKYFKIKKDNTLAEIPGTEDMYTRSRKHGTVPRMIDRMFGVDSRYEPSSKIAKKLNLGTTTDKTVLEDMAKEDGIMGKIGRKLTGVKKYNIIDRAIDEGLAEKDPIEYRKNLQDISRSFSQITKAPNQKTLSKIHSFVENEMNKDILEAIMSNDQETMVSTITKYSKELRNKDLESLIKKGASDREKAAKVLSINSSKITNTKDIMKYKDLLKREAFKEILIAETVNETTGKANYNKMLVGLRQAGITGKEYDNAKNIAHWATLQMKGKLFSKDSNEKGLETIKKANNRVLEMLSNQREKDTIPANAEFIQDLRKTIFGMKENYADLTTRTTEREMKSKKVMAEMANDTFVMRKAYTSKNYAKDMIRDINNTSKMKANSKKFFMQFVAGKNTPEYVTDYTMMPYFFTQRLVEPFNNFGLGLAGEDMSSVGSMWKAIMLKRALPVAAGITAFSYLNYEAKNLTGTSITGAMAQGIANVDLGIRKIADATGVGKLLEAERRLNPISQYWLGEDYQNYEERKDYYENGYDEVRKGRWWAFGSASEFRGGKISYFQPNFVKRANSDWKDIGIYGSTKEKWAHSWVPTLRHPFAPIRRALDPYWLERKNYKDRPYMKTAPLFSTGTPWGAVLNPTVGEIIKPVRNMHKNETRRGLVDPRVLIQERNERIKAKAIDKEKGNLVQISENGITNVSYTPSALADKGNAVITLRAGNGQVQNVDYNGIGYQEGVAEIKDAVIDSSEATGPGTGGTSSINTYVVGGEASNSNKFNFLNSLETTRIGSIISNSIGSSFNTRDIIQETNAGIKQAATGKADGAVIEQANLAKIPFRQATQRLTTRQEESDLLLTTSKHDFINDAIFSGKQLSGIYGFLGGLLNKDKGKKVRLESAEKMSSFKRSFWDANVGGTGGGIMEIARRFFPHDDHSWTEINPIRNTMPEWMPTRFQTGDPYTKLPKGEMRLPGKGYESIHKLRSDEYGKYGALDRMRILGDIAPWSEEYKTWRDIASKTITDAEGKKEIQEIKKRVEKQSRAHEFYNYKFLGNPSTVTNETVDSIEGTTIKTTSGKTYSMAGIKLSKDADISPYLYQGASIQVEHLKKDKGISGEIAAAIYVGGENINKRLVDSGQAEGDTSTAMGAKALTGQFGQIYGAAMEAVAHAPIPFIHSKLMKIDTPLESYKNERVYGTPYSTWDHPIKGFIMPAFQKAWARGPIGQGIALGSWALAEKVWDNPEKAARTLNKIGIGISETGVNRLASTIFNAANPGAFAGSMMAAIPTGLMDASEGIKGLTNASIFNAATEAGAGRNGARLGAIAMLAGYGITRSDKPLESTAIFAAAGVALSKQLAHKSFNVKQGAIAGAAVGFTISAIRNPRFNKDKMFGVYTPETTKKRWDIDEYYDRLEYIKYQGLYNKAARKARFWERTNIKKIIRANEYKQEANKKKIEKLHKKLDKVSNSNLEESRKEELAAKLNKQIQDLSIAEQTFRAGKYTKAAIAYKQAADSTIYGLKENATSQQVLRAIPKGDKDFFMEFAKEKNKKKQDEILKYVSKYQRRALQIAWGRKKIDKVKSNKEYFNNHFMPGVFWAGWNPRVDMENVKMKTIENEGMLLSDFGIYESQSNEPAAVNAPSVGKFDKANSEGLGLKARLAGALNGTGLIGTKITVSPTSANGIEVIANITNAAKITEYKVREGVNKMMGTRMFY